MPQVLGEGAHKQLRPHTYQAETPYQQALPLRICAVTTYVPGLTSLCGLAS